jgi:hypothetical protein
MGGKGTKMEDFLELLMIAKLSDISSSLMVYNDMTLVLHKI